MDDDSLLDAFHVVAELFCDEEIVGDSEEVDGVCLSEQGDGLLQVLEVLKRQGVFNGFLFEAGNLLGDADEVVVGSEGIVCVDGTGIIVEVSELVEVGLLEVVPAVEVHLLCDVDDGRLGAVCLSGNLRRGLGFDIELLAFKVVDDDLFTVGELRVVESFGD